MEKLLYSSSEIRTELIEMLNHKSEEKIVIVAFIGKGAEKYIPFSTERLSIYCWPKEGVTNPYVIENYLQNGAKVYFVDKLHIKLYWVERNGAIVTSANLTNNALGSNGLYEFGVRLFEFNHDNIEKIIKSLNCIKIELEAPILEKLKKDYEMFQRNNEPYAEKYTNSDIDTFDKWYKKREKKFRVLFTSETGKLSDETIDLINNEYNLEKPHSFFTGIEPGEYEIYEYIFTFTCFEANDDIRIKRKNGQWFIGDIITKNGEMIQLKRLNKKTNKPPFLLDSKFKESFKNIFNESDDIDNIINDKSEFKEGFLEKLFTEYTSNENMI